MRLAIVGSVSLAGNDEAIKLIGSLLDELKPDTVISGGAVGIDSMAALAAIARGIFLVQRFPKNQRWAPEGFKDRNLLIAQDCDMLIRIADPKSKTYGSGWTMNQAKKLGKPTREIFVENKQ